MLARLLRKHLDPVPVGSVVVMREGRHSGHAAIVKHYVGWRRYRLEINGELSRRAYRRRSFVPR